LESGRTVRLALSLAAVLAAAAPAAAGDLYRRTDARGVVHFTDAPRGAVFTKIAMCAPTTGLRVFAPSKSSGSLVLRRTGESPSPQLLLDAMHECWGDVDAAEHVRDHQGEDRPQPLGGREQARLDGRLHRRRPAGDGQAAQRGFDARPLLLEARLEGGERRCGSGHG